MADPLAEKRARLLALAADIPARCRLVETSEGHPLARKLRKLSAFGPRYVRWAAARAGMPPSEVEFPLFWGRKIRLPYSNDADFVTFYLTGAPGGPEYKLARWLIRTLQPNDRFYDAGANHGFYSLLASELIGPEGEVHAFEPMPDMRAALERNAPEIRVIEAALWDSTATAPLYRNPLSSALSTLEPEVDAFHPSKGKPYEVRTITLDVYVEANAAPTVIKIDVEGGEKRLIAGAARTLKLKRPFVAMEVWAGEAGARFSVPAATALLQLGYSAYELTEDGKTRPLPVSELRNYCLGLPGFWDNLVFLPS